MKTDVVGRFTSGCQVTAIAKASVDWDNTFTNGNFFRGYYKGGTLTNKMIPGHYYNDTTQVYEFTLGGFYATVPDFQARGNGLMIPTGAGLGRNWRWGH